MISEDQNTASTTTTADTADGTGAPGDAVASCLVSGILACYDSLSKFATLDPCPAVDSLFGKLVHLCRQTPTDATTARVCVSCLFFLVSSFLFLIMCCVNIYLLTPLLVQVLNDPRIVEITPHLRQLCADGEYRLEAYWVEKLTRFETQEDGISNPALHSLSSSLLFFLVLTLAERSSYQSTPCYSASPTMTITWIWSEWNSMPSHQ